MKTVTKKQFNNNIIKFFEKNAGMSIAKAKNVIRKQLKQDEFDNDFKVGNVRLFYTSNDNYKQGQWNGGGKGWYLTNCGFTGGSEIKLAKKF